MMFERADLPSRDYESIVMFRPYTHYAAPVVPSPAGSELIDDWYAFWALAQRLGKQIVFDGIPLDMRRAPDTDALLAILARHGSVPFAELRASDAGRIFEVEPQFVAAGTSNARFAVIPADVAAELQDVMQETTSIDAASAGFSHRLIVRRMREVQNTMYHHLPSIHRRAPFNPACMHPDDFDTLGLADGDEIEIISPHGSIPAIAAIDETLRSGVVSMSHGWGGLPDEQVDYTTVGSSTNLLTSSAGRDRINAMPTMSAIPVRIVRRNGASASTT
jgi:anaerobic selenocysteine-containing dehydrogenase